jgi:Myb-like DNA-binding protein FlbD
MIEQMVREMGRHWAEIARRLGNRSDNAVKNWWNGSMNRKKRHGPQGSHGAKTQVGHRTQPIPATRPSRVIPAEERQHRSEHSPIQQTSHAWTRESPEVRTLEPSIVSERPIAEASL